MKIEDYIKEISKKGYVMNCPKCRNVKLTMKDHSLSSPNCAGHLSCPQSDGVWIKSSEIDNIAACYVEEVEAGSIAGKSPGPDSKTGLCPDGHRLMIRARVPLDPPFYLERCPDCGGIWVDRGELGRIIEHNLDEHLKVIWTQAWRRQQRQEKENADFHSKHKELLGDDIYNSVLDLAGKLKGHPEQSRALALLRNELTD